MAKAFRDFRSDRLSKIQANETPWPMPEGAKVVLHICPEGATGQRLALDSATVNNLRKAPMLLSPVCETGYNPGGYNSDGYCTYTAGQSGNLAGAYLQMFRSGFLETVNHRILKDKAIPSESLEEGVIRCLPRYFETLKALTIDPPVFVMLSFVGVLGFRMAVPPPSKYTKEIDRDILLCPEILIEDFTSEVEARMKPALDAVWNAVGWQGSPNYQGNRWVPHGP